MQPIDCWMCETQNRWHCVDAHFNHTETAFVHRIIVCNQSYAQYFPQVLRWYVLSFASRSFVTTQFLINSYLCYLSKKWSGPTTFPRLRPAIDGMWFISLVFGKYSLTSSPLPIQLLLLDFHDVPQAISTIPTMCTGAVWGVMQLDTWMNLAWRLSLRSSRHAHWPLVLWHECYHSARFC